MPIPEMTPSQKYEQFVKSHPQYKKMSMDSVCSIMVKQKLLSSEEVKALKRPLFGFNNSALAELNEETFGFRAMGLNLTNKNNHPKPTNYVERPKTYHPVITQLPVEKSGKVNLNNFTMNGLKSQYDSKNYAIFKNKKGEIIGLSKSLRDKLINHVETLYCKNAKPKDSGSYLAEKLFDDIQGLGSGKLAEHVKMINSKNLKYVLTEYRNLTAYKQIRTFHTYNDLLYFGKRIGLDLSSDKGQEAVKKLAPLEGLLTAIQGEFGLKQSTRNSLIKQIVKVALEDKDSGTKSRISKDISQHHKDTYKVEVDLYRASNSADGDLRNPKLNEARLNTTKNKTFKGQVKQGKTGDCWLLAGLNSSIANPSALKQLEKQVKYDPKTGNYSVYMNGLKQTYVVTKEDLKNSTAISSGSEKVNAVEIAMDKYMRDSAYNEKGRFFGVDEKFGSVGSVTIDANFSSTLWNTLFGDNYNYKMRFQIDPLKEDFNNPRRLYGFSLSGSDDKRTVLGVASSNKSKDYEIISRHAYSIIGSDEKNIYFSNPWDSSEKITISRADFKNIGYNLDIYEFK